MNCGEKVGVAGLGTTAADDVGVAHATTTAIMTVTVMRCSALLRIADPTRTSREVRKVPEGTIRAGNYSISSSASVSKFGGTVIPSCLAVLRLTTSQNLLACSIGRSPGFTPRTILAA